MYENILSFIKDFQQKYNYKGGLIGISGGLDSAVSGKLLVDSIGKENVYGLLMPERDSSKETLNDSILVCDYLGIKYKVFKISKVLRKLGTYKLEPPTFFVPKKIQENYVKNKWKKEGAENTFLKDLKNEGNDYFLKGLAYYRSKHRIRMCKMYLEAEKRGYFVCGTTNKTELMTGLYVKYGDDSVDIEPIWHLYKTEVMQLAKELKIPEKIINKKPSPDLIPGITDEDAFEMSYLELDNLIKKINSNDSLEEEDPKKVDRVKKIIENAQYRKIKNEHL